VHDRVVPPLALPGAKDHCEQEAQKQHRDEQVRQAELVHFVRGTTTATESSMTVRLTSISIGRRAPT
jgi:hypothetical protein